MNNMEHVIRWLISVLAHSYEEAKDYQRKHIAHVENWGIEGPKVNESLTDIAVYAVIMRVMQQHWQNEK